MKPWNFTTEDTENKSFSISKSSVISRLVSSLKYRTGKQKDENYEGTERGRETILS
jgi:hypothetical protein